MGVMEKYKREKERGKQRTWKSQGGNEFSRVLPSYFSVTIADLVAFLIQ